MKTPLITPLQLPKLMQAALNLPLQGTLARSSNQLLYLDIDDNYIHQLYPLVDLPFISKPNYFCLEGIGAHISVIYPEEYKSLLIEELGISYQFNIKQFVSAEFEHKIYYVLLVESYSLLKLRRQYKLPDYLNFKGYKISFHITIAKSL